MVRLVPPASPLSHVGMLFASLRRPEVPKVACLNLPHLGSLAHRLWNITPKLKVLVERWFGGVDGWRGDGRDPRLMDVRGSLVPPDGAAQTFLDRDLVASWKDAHGAGMSCAALAREHGLHKMTVVHQLRKAGLETRRPPLAASADLVGRVHGLRAKGLSERGIAKEPGVSKSSVHRLLAVNSG